MADAIRDWLTLHAKGEHPKSDDMPWLTWAENVERLKAILLQDARTQTAAFEGTCRLQTLTHPVSGLA